jgi:hypothetical protein
VVAANWQRVIFLGYQLELPLTLPLQHKILLF